MRLFSGRTRPRDRHGCRRLGGFATLLIVAALAAAVPSRGAAAPSAELAARLATAAPDARIPVIATMRAQVDGDDVAGGRAGLLRALRRTAARTQDDVADHVDAPVDSFWLVNAMAFRGTPDEIRAVAADPAVERVDLDVQVETTDADAPPTIGTPFPDPGPGNWGLGAIRAPQAWSEFGVRGQGVLIGSIDTGVDPANPDLAGKIAGWRDFATGSAQPFDDNGHGTHTIGIMVGGSARGAPVGVAPGARVLVARAMGADGRGPGSALLAAAQWMTDPDGDPATADQPAIVNNSWSAPDANDPWFRSMIRRWLELGIVPVFAAGNTGPGASTIGSPAGYPEALAVGALSENGSAASFSGRGPIMWQDIDGTGPAAGTVLTKPDLSAPGEGITSTVGTGYLGYSGTSMAAPHVAGVAALVKQLRPALAGAALADVLRQSAVDLGAPGPDPATGAGRVDAVNALTIAQGPVPDTRFTASPGAATRERTLRFAVETSGGGVGFRTRVDGGAWSAVQEEPGFEVTVAEGRHLVEAQAVDAAGAVDPSPARRQVTVDRTRPRATLTVRRSGTALVFTAKVSDPLSGASASAARWSFGDGDTAGGARVVRRFAESRARRVVLRARDAAGNETFVGRTVRPPAATALRALRTPNRASRHGGRLAVTARLARPAGLRALLRPVSPVAATQQRGLAAAFAAPRLGRPRAQAVVTRRTAGVVRLTLPIGRLSPGTYRLEVTAPEGRTRGPAAVRTVVIR
ncbi:MAG: S8 family serine peptidase [Thermoleophilia bacterium]